MMLESGLYRQTRSPTHHKIHLETAEGIFGDIFEGECASNGPELCCTVGGPWPTKTREFTPSDVHTSTCGFCSWAVGILRNITLRPERHRRENPGSIRRFPSTDRESSALLSVSLDTLPIPLTHCSSPLESYEGTLPLGIGGAGFRGGR